MDELKEDFNDLNEMEQLLRDDNLDEFRMIELFYSTEMTEVCAFFGSNKCLAFLEEQGVEISPLINLYAILNNHTLCINIPHEDELAMCLKCMRIDRIKDVEKPDIKSAVKALMIAFNDCQSMNIDYPMLVFQMYPEDEWRKIIKGKALRELIQHNHPYILPDIRLKGKDLVIMLNENIEIPSHRLPHICITTDIKAWKEWYDKIVFVSSKRRRVRLS